MVMSGISRMALCYRSCGCVSSIYFHLGSSPHPVHQNADIACCSVYIGETLYVVALALTKVSLVFMYLRIFSAYRPFQIASYTMLAFIVLPSLVIVMLTILSCQPIAHFWDRDLPGHCLDVTAVAYANSALAVAQDLLLIVLPVVMLWNLNMSRRKKCLIALMFAVGSLGLVATVVRLSTLHVFGNLEDPTWDYVPVVYWTVVELAAGMICSCLPAIRILLERFFGVLQLTTHHRSHPSDAIRMKNGGGGGGPQGGRLRRRTPCPTTEDPSFWKDGDGKWPDDMGSVSQRKLTLSRDGTVLERPLFDTASSGDAADVDVESGLESRQELRQDPDLD